MNNFNNMPSFTKELRRALYSNSNIQSYKNNHSNSYNQSSNSGGHSFNQKNNNESTQIFERKSEKHMHKDNQTLLQVIIEKRNNNSLIDFNYENRNKNNCKIYKDTKDKSNNNIIKETNKYDNHFNNDLLVLFLNNKGRSRKNTIKS